MAQRFGGETCLGKIAVVGIDAEDFRRAAAFHLDRIEAGVAADVEHRFSRQVFGNGVRKARELEGGIIAQEMVRRGFHAADAKIVEPWADRKSTRLNSSH